MWFRSSVKLEIFACTVYVLGINYDKFFLLLNQQRFILFKNLE